MTACKIARLESRAVIEIGGDDAFQFLQGLVTSNVEPARDGGAVHAALLTPQGKILFDFFIIARDGGGFWIDCRKELAGDLLKRLTFYKLRAKVEITDRSSDHMICAAWGGVPKGDGALAIAPDPRLDAMGMRLILSTDTDFASLGCGQATEDDYHAHRIALGVPEGGVDFAFGDTFPHEADYDQLGSVDFAKGCFIGQEVVSRMQHRGTARKRIIPVTASAPLTAGAEITAGESAIGTLGSVAGESGLGLIRLDRAEKAIEDGKTLEAGGVAIRLGQPEWAKFTVPGAGGAA
jgi:tRNA-modifying protein YgfZ